LHGNASRIKIGLSASPVIELKAGQTATFNVQNTNQITIEAKTDGDGVVYSAEQEA